MVKPILLLVTFAIPSPLISLSPLSADEAVASSISSGKTKSLPTTLVSASAFPAFEFEFEVEVEVDAGAPRAIIPSKALIRYFSARVSHSLSTPVLSPPWLGLDCRVIGPGSEQRRAREPIFCARAIPLDLSLGDSSDGDAEPELELGWVEEGSSMMDNPVCSVRNAFRGCPADSCIAARVI
jgi:hypothetical protein